MRFETLFQSLISLTLSSIPVVACIIVCIFLHRRFLARQRREDNDSKHKSLDFGTGMSRKLSRKGKKGAQRIPEMGVSDFEKNIRRGRGMSMDLDMPSPYILPAALKGSRESLHSLSRSMNDEYDPYRPVTMASDNASQRFPSRMGHRGDNGSTYTGYTGHTTSSHGTDAVNAGLLKNSRGMPQSRPPRGDSMSIRSGAPPGRGDSMSPTLSSTTTMNNSAFSKEAALPPPPPPPVPPTPEPPMKEDYSHNYQQKEMLAAPQQEPERDSYFDNNAHTFLNNDTYVPPPRSTSNSMPQNMHSSPPQSRITSHDGPTLPAINIQEDDFSHNANDWDDYNYTQGYDQHFQEAQVPSNYDQHYDEPQGLSVQQPDLSSHRLSMSVRPLPPDDPSEDAETRANRIRSFYKEYFDENRPNPGAMRMPTQEASYYEDYDQEYLGDGAVFDPETGQFVVASRPYAEPVTRRAMTPPPRAPPRFHGAHHGPSSSMHSTGTFAPPPRGMSAMSHRGFGQMPKKALPPPKALKGLPTPSKLKDDSNLIFDSIDFAPPVSFRDRQAGRRPDSPLGSARPYSPTVRAFNPLQSSYDDLNAMPSP